MKKNKPGTKVQAPDGDSFFDSLGPQHLGIALLLLIAFVVVVTRLRRRKKVRPGELAPLPEDAMFGKYKLAWLLADGGTATVYLGHDEDQHSVAIKIPHLDQVRDADFVATFKREAEIGLELRHPSIVRVLAVGSFRVKSSPDIPYFVMEYLEGQELEQMIEANGPMEPAAVLQVARGVADALQWAHQRGVVHRDISPRNIFIGSKRNVKVMDFGISTVSARFSGKKKASKGLSFGTPEYLAPERAVNMGSADVRSDLYSLGCVMYEMLSGKPPYYGGPPERIIAAHRHEPVPALPQRTPANRDLEMVVQKLMAKNPAARYQTAGEVTSALAELVPEFE